MRIIIVAALLLPLCLLTSCNDNDTSNLLPDGGDKENPDLVMSIDVSSQKRFAGDVTPDDEDMSGSNELVNWDEVDDLLHTRFEDGSVIYISQLPTNGDPNFIKDATQDVVINNLYPYKYYENPNASWNTTGEYNFTAINNPISWSTIYKNGPVGNSYVLYGLYFPSGKVGDMKNMLCTEWQNRSTLEGMRNGDVLGAYHTTSSLFSRLRFRFFHLLVYVRVSLFVPVQQVEGGKSTGFAVNAFESNNYSTETAAGAGRGVNMSGVWLGPGNTMKWDKGITINWRANQSSDNQPPLTQSVGTNKACFDMYLHRELFDDDVEFRGEKVKAPRIRTIDKSQFSSKQSGTDQVRVYEFSALVPAQSVSTSDALLTILLKEPNAPAGAGTNTGPYKTYTVTSSGIKTGSNSIKYEQGTIQHYKIYIPRSGNQGLLIGATVHPWDISTTGMPLYEEE